MDPTQAPPAPPGSPGHYGPGYGEVAREDASLDPDATTPAGADPERAVAGAPISPGVPGPADDAGSEGDREAAPAQTNSEGEAVVFTADDVTARPPDHPPTEHAPESEKAGLIFERS
jgi:hypothetical protein